MSGPRDKFEDGDLDELVHDFDLDMDAPLGATFAAALRDMVEYTSFSRLIARRFAPNLAGTPNATSVNALASAPITAVASPQEIGKKSAKLLPFSGPAANSPVA